jgi:hypothetical protein
MQQIPLQTDSPGSEYDKETSLFILFSTHNTHNQNEISLRKSQKEN